jgi:hypothetical protein
MVPRGPVLRKTREKIDCLVYGRGDTLVSGPSARPTVGSGTTRLAMKKIRDPLHTFLKLLGRRRGVIPPFTLELSLVDGNWFYLHSVQEAAEDSVSISLRVWDTRALDDEELDRLHADTASIDDLTLLSDPKNLHPHLDWAVLRVDLDQIAYCVEWHHPLWSSDESKQSRQRLH